MAILPTVEYEDRRERSSRKLDNAPCWTLLVASPSDKSLGGVKNPIEELAFGVLPTLPLLLLRQATSCLSSIIEGYEELLDKIESNLGDRDGILDPDNHGKLLIEDQSFERSRRYFWTIDALDTFSGTLKESLKTFEQFTDAIRADSPRIQGIFETESLHPNDEEGSLIRYGVKKNIAEANMLLERIKAIKEKTITLRDGVCPPCTFG